MSVTFAPRFALWQLAFRPGFLGAASAAVGSMLLWMLVLEGAVSWSPEFPIAWWHAHEMLFGFAIPVVVGFALTAVATWTGTKGTTGARLMLLFAAWLAARLLLLLPLAAALPLAALADTLFIIGAAWELGTRIIGARQARNYAFIPILSLFAGGNLLSYANHDRPEVSVHIHYAILLLFILLIGFVGGRVIPFFTSRRLDFEQPPILPWLDYGALALLLMVVALAASGSLLEGCGELQILLLVAALAHLLRLCRWQGWRSGAEPLLWSLHLSYLFIPAGLTALALVIPNPVATKNIMHLLGVGAMAGVILSMMARVSLGHTGRPLQAAKLVTGSFALLALGALVRGALPVLLPAATLWSWRISALCWLLAFGGFLICYTCALLTRRPDGKPG